RIMWLDELACKTQEHLVIVGALHKDQQGYTSGTKHPLTGRIELKVQLIRTFSDGCQGALAKAIACRQDAANCRQQPADYPPDLDPALYAPNQDLQHFYSDLFAPYIDFGLITESQIPALKSIAYEVTYQ